MSDTKAKIIALLDNMSEEQLARVLENISPEYTLPESAKGMEIGERVEAYGMPQDGTIDFESIMSELRRMRKSSSLKENLAKVIAEEKLFQEIEKGEWSLENEPRHSIEDIQRMMWQAEKEIADGKFKSAEEVVSEMRAIIQRPKQNANRQEMFGCLRGAYTVSDEFDAPLESFKEYME